MRTLIRTAPGIGTVFRTKIRFLEVILHISVSFDVWAATQLPSSAVRASRDRPRPPKMDCFSQSPDSSTGRVENSSSASPLKPASLAGRSFLVGLSTKLRTRGPQCAFRRPRRAQPSRENISSATPLKPRSQRGAGFASMRGRGMSETMRRPTERRAALPKGVSCVRLWVPVVRSSSVGHCKGTKIPPPANFGPNRSSKDLFAL